MPSTATVDQDSVIASTITRLDRDTVDSLPHDRHMIEVAHGVTGRAPL